MLFKKLKTQKNKSLKITNDETSKTSIHCIAVACATAVAAHDFEVDGIFYNITDATNKTVAVTYKGTSYSQYFNEYTGSVVILESVTYNGKTYSVTSIEECAFEGCSGLTSITILDGVKSIAEHAFYNCSNVKSLYISSTIESIGIYAFGGCNNILDIKIGSQKAITANKSVFTQDAYVNACLYVPNGRKFAYEKATPWNEFYIVEMDFTGIENVKTEPTVDTSQSENRKGNYYDLNGRAVENPTKGIYILNGKKVMVK